MSDTPETDTVIATDTGDSGFISNLAQLAKRLERERDEARSVRDEVLQRLSVWEGAVSQMKQQLSFAPPFHQGTPSQEEA